MICVFCQFFQDLISNCSDDICTSSASMDVGMHLVDGFLETMATFIEAYQSSLKSKKNKRGKKMVLEKIDFEKGNMILVFSQFFPDLISNSRDGICSFSASMDVGTHLVDGRNNVFTL